MRELTIIIGDGNDGFLLHGKDLVATYARGCRNQVTLHGAGNRINTPFVAYLPTTHNAERTQSNS